MGGGAPVVPPLDPPLLIARRDFFFFLLLFSSRGDLKFLKGACIVQTNNHPKISTLNEMLMIRKMQK